MSLEQFTYSYIFKISQPVYYTMNQLYICLLYTSDAAD